MTGYSVEIKETSLTLGAKDRIKFKDTSDAIKLDEATKESALIISPKGYVILGVHNDKADPKDYDQYLIVDENGNKYATGSASFFNAFMDIFTEMAKENEEYEIKCYRLESKNYKGKQFITCSII